MMRHPLVKKEWKSLKWVMLLFSIIFVFFTLVLSDKMTEEKTFHLLGQYEEAIFINHLYDVGQIMIPVLLITMIVLAGVLFVHDRNLYIGKFISSLPYTRREQFKIKYLMGTSTFTVPLIFFTGALYMIRGHHQSWTSRVYQYNPLGSLLKSQDGVGVLLTWLIFLWLILLTTYSFLMMIQTLIGQNIVASIVGGIAFLVPLFLAYAIPINLISLGSHRNDFRWIEKVGKWVQLFLFGRPELKYAESYLVLNGYDFFDSYTHLYRAYNYQWFPLYVIVLILGIMISALLGFYFIQGNDVEKNGEIALYPWVKKLLVIGTTLCSLLLLPIIIQIFTSIESPIVTIIAMIIGASIGFFISYKSIEMTTKHR